MHASSPRIALLAALLVGACGGGTTNLESTAATATAIRGGLRLDGEAGGPLVRVPLGGALEVVEASLAELVLDAGPRLVLDAGAALVVAAPDEVTLGAGRVFCDVAAGDVLAIAVPGGALSLTGAAVSAVLEGGVLRAYVVRGEASYRAGERRGVVRAGEELTLGADGAGVAPRTLWDDWTGGLVAAGPEGAAAPGMGSLEARVPDEVGLSRWPLVMRRLEVNVRVEGTLAITEVTQEFFNPASDTVEGLYRVRVPEGAVLQRFAVDRNGALVDGYVREQAAARAAYEARVYRGSTEDPALLEWDAPGRYRARIYPIAPGESRRIAIRYAEWLAPAREGGPLLYRYPLGGAGGRAPLVGELAFTADVGGAGAGRVRAGLDATVTGSLVELRRSDFRPRADLFLELFVEGAGQRAYRAAHSPPTRAPGSRVIVNEADERDYFYLPLHLPERLFGEASGPLDVVVVADVSAGTDAGRLELGRAVVESIARRLGPDDRLSVVGADLTLRPLGGDPAADDASRMALAPAEPERIESALDALARIPVGGATDLGASLAEAAALLDPARDGIVVYVGDGAPTVGSLEAAGLREQLAALPHPLRLYAVAVGAEANLDLLAELARGGGLAMRVEEHRGAADASLRIFAHAGRPVLDGVTVELGSGVENVFPRTAVSVARGEALELVGRVRDGAPSEVVVRGTLRGAPFTETIPIATEAAEDAVDLRLRWAGERLRQQLREGASREEIAELGTRYGLITPYTSYYVPSHTELAALDRPMRRALRHEGVLAGRSADEQAGAAAAAVLLGPLGIAGCALSGASAPSQGSAPMPEEPVAVAPALAEASEPETAAEATNTAPSSPVPASAPMPSAPAAGAPMAPPPPPSRARGAAGPTPSTPYGGEPTEEGSDRPDDEGRRALDAPGYGAVGSGRAAASAEGTAAWAADDARTAEAERMVIGALGDGSLADVLAGGAATGTASEGLAAGSGYGSGGRARTSRRDGDSAATVVVTTTTIVTTTRPEDHVRSRCSDAARLPLDDRRALWRERLAQSDSVSSWVETYRQAVRDCEAAAPRERRALLGELTARAGSVASMLDLYSYLSDASARAHVRSAVLRAVRTPEDLRLVRSRLGTSVSADWSLVEQVLARATTPAARLRALRELIAQRPGSFELRLRLLAELEAQGRVADAVRLADALRADPLADAGVRTAVGELLLRLGRQDEARRAFSEIVEFAPLDELARRRLGDLYRAHGWFEDAYRQYQTLAEIRPDDPTVLLLLASAAAGAGRTDEALRLEQRLMETSAPSAGGALRGGLPRVAQLWSSVRFALLRREAREAGDDERLAALLQRMRRSGVLAGSPALRASLTWTHPDARLSLWASHPGGPVTRPEDLSPEFGLEAFEVTEQEAGTYRIEVRRGGEDRVGTVEGQLVVVWNEGREGETVQVVPVRFAPDSPSTLAFTVTGTSLVEGGAR